MPATRIKEDELTERLAECLTNEEFQQLYLEFLFDGKPPGEILADFPLRVVTQHRFSEEAREDALVGSRGRIDLLLIGQSGRKSHAIGVEHKVWDEEKPSRLHNYKLLLEGETTGQTWLFEFVREKDYDLEDEQFVDTVFRWRELHDFLGRHAKILSPENASRLQALQYAMAASGALVEGVIRRGRRPELQVSESGESLLGDLLALCSDLDAKNTRDKGIPLHLRIGLPDWNRKHPGRWHQRLWVFSKDFGADGYGVGIQFLFHNANFTDLEYAESRFADWAGTFAHAGMVIYRGPARGWDGAKRVELSPPWVLGCKPKYFYAEEPPAISCKTSTQKLGRENFLKSARERIDRYLAIFDAIG